MLVFDANEAEQIRPQLMADGVLDTVPLPETATVKVFLEVALNSETWLAATGASAEFVLLAAVELPLPPPQAVSVTSNASQAVRNRFL